MNPRNIKILSTGIALPNKRMTAEEMDEKLGFKEGYFLKRVGVASRYIATDELPEDLAAVALLQAVEKAGLALKDLDAVICASASYIQPLPFSAVIIHSTLKLDSKVVIFDLDSSCLSFVTALDMISYSIEAGRFSKVAIVTCELPSKIINWEDEESSALFGDGASCVIVGKSDGSSKIISSHTATYSEGVDLCTIEGGGTKLTVKEHNESNWDRYCFKMNGTKVFALASKHFEQFIEDLLTPVKLKVSDLDFVVPHQASLLALKQLQKKIGVKEEQIIFTIHKYGNTVAASIPMALHEAIQTDRIKRGDTTMLVGTSAGLCLGGMILEY